MAKEKKPGLGELRKMSRSDDLTIGDKAAVGYDAYASSIAGQGGAPGALRMMNSNKLTRHGGAAIVGAATGTGTKGAEATKKAMDVDKAVETKAITATKKFRDNYIPEVEEKKIEKPGKPTLSPVRDAGHVPTPSGIDGPDVSSGLSRS